MSRAYVFLADGFEEIEALAPVDLLRRAGVEVRMVSIGASKLVRGRSGIGVEADLLFEESRPAEADLLMLPGGMPGTTNLMKHEGVRQALLEADADGRWVTAICAAPTVLSDLGITKGRRATSYPGTGDKMAGCIYVEDREVVKDGHVITSRGAGTAIAFGLALIEALEGAGKARAVSAGIVYR